MLRVAVILLIIKALPVSLLEGTLNKNLRFCISNKHATEHIRNSCVILKIENSGVECVEGIDRQDCLQRIRDGRADFGVFSPEDLVSAQSIEDAVVIAEIRARDKTFQRYTVAVVGQNVLADRSTKLHAVLKDRALCHPGTDVDDSGAFSRTLSGYLEFLVQPSECSSDENRIKTLAEYFGRSCRAGPWVTDAALDTKLKRQYSSLCAACGSGTCSAKDRYWGALGALACVVEVGEVAWAELDDVKNFFAGSFFGLRPMRGRYMTPESYSLLCPDYTSQTIANASEGCVWLQQPWPAVVTRIIKFLDVDKLIKWLSSSEGDYRRGALATVLGTRGRLLTPLQYPAYTLDYLARARGFLDAYSVKPCEEDAPRDIFKCDDGQQIQLSKICDGIRDCSDGSDETASACQGNTCESDQFRCAYGGCIAAGSRCDGKQDCVDVSDELIIICARPGSETTFNNISLALLSINQPPDPFIFKCDNRQQIRQSKLCDGAKDCTDGSDETWIACNAVTCSTDQFTCAYGACVAAEAKCDGKQDCADGSDESQECKKPDNVSPTPLSEVLLSLNQQPDPHIYSSNSNFKCDDKQEIPQSKVCDGTRDCADGSDETKRACSYAVTCSADKFTCAYGGCVAAEAKCDGKQDCADGSDEADDCKKPGNVSPALLSRGEEQPAPTFSTTSAPVTFRLSTLSPMTTTTIRAVPGGPCILPPYPARGTYVVADFPGAVPGQNFSSVQYTVFCHYGFGIQGNRERSCVNGYWTKDVGPCLSDCRLTFSTPQDVIYTCYTDGIDRPCGRSEAHGSVAVPECGSGYYSPRALTPMLCDHGRWNYTAICLENCGVLQESGNKNQDLPWQALIYRKTSPTYRHRCAGTLVSPKLVLSAADCFLSPSQEMQAPASEFAVAVGKMYLHWDKEEMYQQTSNVRRITIPVTSKSPNSKREVAFLTLKTHFEYTSHVLPACLSQHAISRDQLFMKGNIGKFAAFGGNGRRNNRIATSDLTYITNEECRELIHAKHPGETLEDHKFCTHSANSSLCIGDSGSGVAFPVVVEGVKRYYIAGIASSAQRIEYSPCGESPIVFIRLTFELVMYSRMRTNGEIRFFDHMNPNL